MATPNANTQASASPTSTVNTDDALKSLQGLQGSTDDLTNYIKSAKPQVDQASQQLQEATQGLKDTQAKAPTYEKEPESPDLKFRQASLGSLFGAIVAGLIAGRAAHTGGMMTAAASLNKLVEAHNAGEQDRIATAQADFKEKVAQVGRHNQLMRDQYSDAVELAKTNVSLASQHMNLVLGQIADGITQRQAIQGGFQKQAEVVKGILDHNEKVQHDMDEVTHWSNQDAEARRRTEAENTFKADVVDADGKAHTKLFDKHSGQVIRDLGTAAPKAGQKLSVAEEKATTNYVAMSNAEKVIEAQLAKGVNPSFLAMVDRDDNGYMAAVDRWGRKIALNPDQQVLAQASAQFAEGAGHLKSGARINRGTLDIMNNLYLPNTGDSPELIQRKTEARLNDITAARIASGHGAVQFDQAQQGEAPADDMHPGTEEPAPAAAPQGQWGATLVK